MSPLLEVSPVMFPLLLPIAATGLFVTWRKAKKRSAPQMTPNIQYLFQRLLDSKLTPAKYREAADEFAKQGFTAEATTLRARASYSELPAETKATHKTVIAKALASSNPDAIRDLADHLHTMGAVANAVGLRKHAAAVETANAIAPVKVPTPLPDNAPPPPMPTPEVIEAEVVDVLTHDGTPPAETSEPTEASA